MSQPPAQDIETDSNISKRCGRPKKQVALTQPVTILRPNGAECTKGLPDSVSAAVFSSQVGGQRRGRSLRSSQQEQTAQDTGQISAVPLTLRRGHSQKNIQLVQRTSRTAEMIKSTVQPDSHQTEKTSKSNCEEVDSGEICAGNMTAGWSRRTAAQSRDSTGDTSASCLTRRRGGKISGSSEAHTDSSSLTAASRPLGK